MYKASASSDGSPRATFWGHKSLILVTGASSGIGRAIAVSFAKHVAQESLVVITGRDAGRLEETKRTIVALGRSVSVLAQTCDHSRASFGDYQELLGRASSRVTPDRVVLVHNAASLGNISKRAVSLDCEREIDDYYHLNLTSVITLTAAFLQHFPKSSSRTIINVTSCAAVVPPPGFGLYSAGKAARNTFMKTVAIEDPSLTVLSYHPGLVSDTRMFEELTLGTEEAVTLFEALIMKGMAVTSETTADHLVSLLENQNFQSGDYVEFRGSP